MKMISRKFMMQNCRITRKTEWNFFNKEKSIISSRVQDEKVKE